MGNNYIKETITKHQELRKQIKNDKLDKNLIIFNIPIVIDSYRGSKSYIEQITEASEEELNNTMYNELYLTRLGIKITNDDIKFFKTNELSIWSKPEENIEVLQTHELDNPIYMYKHFDWVVESEPESEQASKIIFTHINNIIRFKDKIKELENQIREEKSKILKLKYVQLKLNKPIGKTNEYIRTVKYLYESLLTK